MVGSVHCSLGHLGSQHRTMVQSQLISPRSLSWGSSADQPLKSTIVCRQEVKSQWPFTSPVGPQAPPRWLSTHRAALALGMPFVEGRKENHGFILILTAAWSHTETCFHCGVGQDYSSKTSACFSFWFCLFVLFCSPAHTTPPPPILFWNGAPPPGYSPNHSTSSLCRSRLILLCFIFALFCCFSVCRYWLDLTSSDIMWNMSDTGWIKAAIGSVFSTWLRGACVFVHRMAQFNTDTFLDVSLEPTKP